jgi:DNA polymerase III delta subunit
VHQQLARLEADAGAEAVLDANRHRLMGNQVNLPELLAVCNALPFMDSHRVVLVEGLLGNFERRPSRGRRRTSDAASTSKSLDGWENLAAAIPEMPETTLLFFVDGPVSESNPLLRLLRPVAEDHGMSTPKGEALGRWIKDSVEQRGSTISPPAIRTLTDMVGSDLWALDRELEKLSLYAGGQRIEDNHVNELVHQAQEANIFAAVDAMIDGREGVALRLLHQLMQGGREALSIIALIERQLRLLALARDSLDKGIPQRDMGSILGVTTPFVVKKTVDQARRHSWKDIIWRYDRLLEADLAIKQGQLEPDLALELLAADQAAMTHR